MGESPLPRLGAITALAVLVHGYHLGVDDSAIYVPAIKQVADPGLYPFGAEFFLSPHTIKSQAISLYRKLGASTRSQAVIRARELGMLEG